VPVILLGSDFWGDLKGWITEVMPKEHGNISPKDLGLLPITDDI